MTVIEHWPCPACGYDLHGLAGDPIRCPECGELNPLDELRELDGAMPLRHKKAMAIGFALGVPLGIAAVICHRFLPDLSYLFVLIPVFFVSAMAVGHIEPRITPVTALGYAAGLGVGVGFSELGSPPAFAGVAYFGTVISYFPTLVATVLGAGVRYIRDRHDFSSHS